MDQNHKQQTATKHQVVAELKGPKVKASGGQIARFNAFALSFAAFFGVMTIFSAISGLTQSEWSFRPPLIDILFANISSIPETFVMALLALAFGVIGLLTINKITDADALKKSWQCVAKVFCALGIVYLVCMVAIALYSLMGLGRKSGLDHEYLWLSNFIPNLIMALTAGGIFFVAKSIVEGKTVLLRLLAIVATAISAIGLALTLIQIFTNFYGESHTIYDDIYDSLMDRESGWSLWD